jgi:hypothetical protein
VVCRAGGLACAPARDCRRQRLDRFADRLLRLPSVSGEIYVVHPNGRRADLSRSPAQDVAPTVSWDGKKVAFVSDRTPKGAVYEVGIDGRGLVRVSPRTRLGWDSSTTLAWQPHGERLALDATDGLWIVDHGRKPVKVSGRGDEFAAKPWSPDGHVFLAEEEQEPRSRR